MQSKLPKPSILFDHIMDRPLFKPEGTKPLKGDGGKMERDRRAIGKGANRSRLRDDPGTERPPGLLSFLII
ncbi:hypothetical protein YDYSY3_21130 [Paenibacillus chitinolyticus]|nr:hypothetical protein YDYSY3_21130 [Paenibacillus chitinolyticus]